MGCGVSIISKKRLLYEHYIPSYCIMRPKMDAAIVATCSESWQRILNGETALYKQWVDARNSGQGLFESTQKSDESIYKKDQPSCRMNREEDKDCENAGDGEREKEEDSNEAYAPVDVVPGNPTSIKTKKQIRVANKSCDESVKSGTSRTCNNSTISPVVFFYDTFYHRLFIKAPELRHLFKQSLKVQGTMLVKVISTITQTLRENKSRALKKYLEDLARRHFDRGVHPEYYGVFVHCMLEAIEACMGEEFTEEVHRAWLNAFSLVLRVMVPVAVDHLLTQGYEDGMPATGSWGWSSTRDILKIQPDQHSTSNGRSYAQKSGTSAVSKKPNSTKLVTVKKKTTETNREQSQDLTDDATAWATLQNSRISSHEVSGEKYRISG